jgi:hypothetical protein
MARQRNSESLNSNTQAAPVPLGLIILIGGLSQTAWQQSDFSCNAVRLAFCMLSSLGLTAWQAMHAHPCLQSIFENVLQLCGPICVVLRHLAALP